MSNIVPFATNMPIPAYLQAPSALDAAMNTDLFATGNPKISIRAGRFRLIENGVEEVLETFSLEVVVVGLAMNYHKAYYKDKYVEGENASPTCSSDDGAKPNASVVAPQNNLCASCPQNAWGSAVVNGSEVKACSDRLSIAVVDSGDVGEGVMYEVDIPPGSLGNFKEYVKQLRQRKLGLEKVLTVMSFDANASAPKLQFGFGGFLSQDQFQQATARAVSDEAKEVTRQNRVARAALAAPAPAVAEVVQIAPAVAVARTATMMGTASPAIVAGAPAAAVQATPAAAVETAPAPAKGFGRKKGAAAAAVQPQAQPTAAPAAQVAAAGIPDLSSLEAELAAFTGTDD